jgi:hypothetical protein
MSDEGLAALRKSERRARAGRRPRRPPEPVRPAPTAAVPRPRRPSLPAAAAPVVPPPTVVLPPGDKPTRWDALNRIVAEDPVCRARLRPGKKVVTGVGSLDAAIMFVGEAPGAEEEVQGEPFVGPAGQLLNKMIGGMALSRADVYIGNIMNWRPETCRRVPTASRPATGPRRRRRWPTACPTC